MLNGSTVLVSGGAGFLGRNVSQRLLEAGAHVICVDNFTTSTRSGLRIFDAYQTFKFIEHDVCTPLDVSCDVIFNLASIASPAAYLKHPVETAMVNVVGTKNLLDLARSQNARFIQASTSEVYGDPEVHPQSEDYAGRVNPVGPRACYHESKRTAEALCLDYRRMFGADVRIARIFNTYGPLMAPDDGRVVSNFVVNALRGTPLVLHGDGSQTRSLCFVDDLLDGLLRLCLTPGSFDTPVNLGSEDEVTVQNLARLVLHATGSQSECVFGDAAVDDPKRRRPDLSRARAVLVWEPTTKLPDGIARTVAYFRSVL